MKQSPGLLKSNSAGGTTGAVLWKVTPLLANWLTSFPSLLSDLEALHPEATVVELGCGLTGLLGQVLSRRIRRYVLTDQPSIVKHLKANISSPAPLKSRSSATGKKKSTDKNANRHEDNLKMIPLDWETDAAENLNDALTPPGNIDLLILCDCVYNEYLINPLVQTMGDICRLGSRDTKFTVVLIAQQLRSDTIFEMFLAALMKEFEVWRVPDEQIISELASDSGYAVHIAMLKNESWS